MAGEVGNAVFHICAGANRFPATVTKILPVDALALRAGKQQGIRLGDALGKHRDDRVLERESPKAVGLACV